MCWELSSVLGTAQNEAGVCSRLPSHIGIWGDFRHVPALVSPSVKWNEGTGEPGRSSVTLGRPFPSLASVSPPGKGFAVVLTLWLCGD